ncbi:hypothetical protein AB0K43_06830 [Kitasatospora sp. NPDC049258]|uniref:hypothetical protein n=1 Tax=Kitasatospora sp. NPDC049258 TaxID=3155394 RepID=UPI0034433FEB
MFFKDGNGKDDKYEITCNDFSCDWSDTTSASTYEDAFRIHADHKTSHKPESRGITSKLFGRRK